MFLRAWTTRRATLRERPRLLVINQYFASREATGQLLQELCSDLSDHFDVTVVAAEPVLLAGAGEVVDPRIVVRRVATARFGRAALALRAVNYATFLVRLPVAALRAGRADVVMCMTDPPVVGLVGLLVARVWRAAFVLSCQDVHPQLGLLSGRLTNRAVVVLLRAAQRVLLRRATRIVALSEAMRDRLMRLGAADRSLAVIPNWVDTDRIRPLPRDTAWARDNGLTEGFVVMHAGNVGQLQDLEVMLEAARIAPEVTFAIVGDGSGLPALVATRDRSRDRNVVFAPWHDRARMSEVLAAADAHLVSLVPGIGGLLEPSKLYGALASGRPVLAALDPEAEGSRIVARHDCGLWVPPGDAAALAAAARRLAALPAAERAAMGERARAYAEVHAGRAQAALAYEAVLTDAMSTAAR